MTVDVDRAGEIVDSLFRLMRTAVSHGPRHPSTDAASNDLRGLLQGTPLPLQLQFVAEAVFAGRTLIPMDAERYARGRAVAETLERLEVNELTFQLVPDTEGILQLGQCLAAGAHGTSEIMQDTRIAGLQWRAIGSVKRGQAEDELPTDIFAAAQVALATSDIEAYADRLPETWSWMHGGTSVRRLERALEASSEGTARALEIAPTAWSVPRRSLSAAHLVLAICRTIDTTRSTRRAAAHAALVVAMSGLEAKGGRTLVAAAQLALPRLKAASRDTVRALPPHGMRVSALVSSIAEGRLATDHRILAPIELAYQLELQRTVLGADFTLTMGDLLAYAVGQMGRAFHGHAVLALIHALGEVPAGAIVELTDGRRGVALGAGAPDEPWRPSVMVDGVTVIPDSAVSIVSTVSRDGGST